MNEKAKKPIVKYAVVISYLAMILVNALANILPINGLNTGEVSDSFPNLFAPAGITFAIWGVIYFLLGAYTLYQLGLFQKEKSQSQEELFNYVGTLFVISSIANTIWIFAWHYKIIGVSLALMVAILVCLILINQKTKKANLTTSQKFFIRLPFSVYFGWISVATIANVTTWLVDLGWSGFGVSEVVWTIIILLVGIAIGILTVFSNTDIAYGLIFVWAYAGITLKHTSPDMFNFQYPLVVYTSMASIVFMLVAIILVVMKMMKKEKGNLTAM